MKTENRIKTALIIGATSDIGRAIDEKNYT